MRELLIGASRCTCSQFRIRSQHGDEGVQDAGESDGKAAARLPARRPQPLCQAQVGLPCPLGRPAGHLLLGFDCSHLKQ